MKHALTLFLLLITTCLQAQTRNQISDIYLPGVVPAPVLPMKEHLMRLREAAVPLQHRPAAKTTSGGPIFDTSRWAHLIDSTWGAGMPDTAKLKLFDYYWGQVDSFYSCFVQLPAYNWDSIVLDMRTEISAGVSRGRFAGIIGVLTGLINDGHSHFRDAGVSYTGYYPGLPLFGGETGSFGACVTTLYDTLAMVYSADVGQPFGLQPGDIILGYNGVSWYQLIKLILKYQLPTSQYIGSTDAATMHRFVQSAGQNWYLFDTINIKKCDGSLVNLPTSLMIGHYFYDFCTEQMPVAGVHKITYSEYTVNNRLISAGVMSGTRIGYVYMLDCSDFSGDSLYKAVRRLVEDSMVHGLILDIRLNYGGTFFAFYKTFDYLYNGTVSWLGIADRLSPADRYTMYNYPSSGYDAMDTISHSWDKPLAILCGPGAISSGDVLSVLFQHYTHVRRFGKSSAGAFGAFQALTSPQPGFYLAYQSGDFFETSNPTYYLSHTNFPVDVPIWFDKDSLCAGKDNIVGDAVRWIQSTDAVTDLNGSMDVSVFPNPAPVFVNVSVTAHTAGEVYIRVLNVLGAVVYANTASINTGNNVIRVNVAGLPKGVYITEITKGGEKRIFKVVKE